MEIDCTYLSYRDTNAFSGLVNDYIDQAENLSSFYTYPVQPTEVPRIIADRTGRNINREVLVNVLRRQYEAIPDNEGVIRQIDTLAAGNTFTVCTAHQPNLLSGYLYFFYKILHAIRMADDLNKLYPQYHFVPVYYMGSEDNDLDELGRFFYEGKQYVWDAEGQTGAVGRMRTGSLKHLLNELFRELGPPGEHLEQLKSLLEAAYLQHDTIAEATRYLVHRLFGEYGLLVLDPDDASLKSLFLPVMEDDLFAHHPVQLARQQSEKLAALYKAQAYPRQINLFYMKDNIRERIERKGEVWQVVNTDIQFSASNLREELYRHPEHFSPNVILRGLYQEHILPNICFIGGGSELAYWLQLKPLFDFFGIHYPMLVLRQSVQIVDPYAERMIRTLGLDERQLFEDEELWMKKRLADKTDAAWKIDAWKEAVSEKLATLTDKVSNIDPTLELSVVTLEKRFMNQLNAMEKKIYRALKRKERVDFNRFIALKERLHIRKGLQERKENFMPYYLSDGFGIFDVIYRHIRPFEQRFMLLKPSVV